MSEVASKSGKMTAAFSLCLLLPHSLISLPAQTLQPSLQGASAGHYCPASGWPTAVVRATGSIRQHMHAAQLCPHHKYESMCVLGASMSDLP